MNLKAAGAVTMTDQPCGTKGWSFGIPWRLPLVLEARYGVGAGVRDVDPRRPEAYAGERGPEHHRAAGLDVLAVLDGAPEVLAAVLQRLGAPHVRYRVRALVGRPVVRALRLGAGVVGFGDVGLGGVADYVEAAGGGDLGRHAHREQGVHDAAVGAEVLVRDAGLHPLFGDVQDRHRRRLGARARGRRDGEQRLQGAGRLLAAADGGVDVVHDLTTVRRYEVGDLRRVDARPAADRDEPVEVSFDGEVRRGLEGVVRRLHARAVPHLDLYAFGLDQLHDAARYVALTTPGSETSITLPTPIRFSSQPASSEAPGPYFSGVASIVKMVSLFDLESLAW